MKLLGKASEIKLLLEAMIAVYGEDAKMADVIKDMAVQR